MLWGRRRRGETPRNYSSRRAPRGDYGCREAVPAVGRSVSPSVSQSVRRARGGGMARGRERVVALVDMDCFFMQVEQRLEPRLRGRPCAVVQYTEWQGGG